MASVARQEEQGFDVNVTSHLLVDTVTGTIDAAVVINNDRDFAYPSHAPENDSQLAWSIPRRGIGQASSPAGRTRGRQSLLVTTVRMLINSGPTVLGRIPANVATPRALEDVMGSKEESKGTREGLTNLWMILPGRGLLALDLV